MTPPVSRTQVDSLDSRVSVSLTNDKSILYAAGAAAPINERATRNDEAGGAGACRRRSHPNAAAEGQLKFFKKTGHRAPRGLDGLIPH